MQIVLWRAESSAKPRLGLSGAIDTVNPHNYIIHLPYCRQTRKPDSNAPEGACWVRGCSSGMTCFLLLKRTYKSSAQIASNLRSPVLVRTVPDSLRCLQVAVESKIEISRTGALPLNQRKKKKAYSVYKLWKAAFCGERSISPPLGAA